MLIVLNRASKTERFSKGNFCRDKLSTQIPIFILPTLNVHVNRTFSVIAENRKRILGDMFHFLIKNKGYVLFLKHGAELVI